MKLELTFESQEETAIFMRQVESCFSMALQEDKKTFIFAISIKKDDDGRFKTVIDCLTPFQTWSPLTVFFVKIDHNTKQVSVGTGPSLNGSGLSTSYLQRIIESKIQSLETKGFKELKRDEA